MCTHAILALKRLKQEDHEFSTSLRYILKSLNQKTKEGAGEMAQWLRALTAPPKVLSSNPSTNMVAHNTPSSGVSENSYSVLTYNK